MTTDVIIVGAGPSGLMAANQLSRFGIPFIIIDKKAGPTRESRALLLTARSLEIYQQLKLDDEIVKNGAIINTFSAFMNGKKKAEINIGKAGIGISDFHYQLAFEQSKNEEILYKNLKNHNHQVLWNTEFIHLKEHQNSIEILAKKGEEEMAIHAKYLIACDGAKSPVRHSLNFKFDGGTYENKFFVVDAIMDWNLEYDRVVVAPGEKSFCGFFPMKGDKTYRVLGTLPKEYFNKEDISLEDVEKVVKGTSKFDLSFEKINWLSIYKLHHRCVDKFREGRVFLAGDSAHIHSPAGGQGMNTGLQDAYNIAWKLAFVLKGLAKPELLDTYNEERLPFAKSLLKFTDRAFAMMTSSNWFIKQFRKRIALNVAGYMLKKKSLSPVIFNTFSQTSFTYSPYSLSYSFTDQKLSFKAGDRLPYASTGCYKDLEEPGFYLLHIGDHALSQNEIDKAKKLFPFGISYIHQSGKTWEKFNVKKELFMVIRPDRYIGYIADNLNPGRVRMYLNRYFKENTPLSN